MVGGVAVAARAAGMEDAGRLLELGDGSIVLSSLRKCPPGQCA
jgi:hypothetical protein